MTRSHYQELIAELIGEAADPRHVEAMMRLEYPVLDWMTTGRLRIEVTRALGDCRAFGAEKSEELAQSMGL
jgi:hypothetical protein